MKHCIFWGKCFHSMAGPSKIRMVAFALGSRLPLLEQVFLPIPSSTWVFSKKYGTCWSHSQCILHFEEWGKQAGLLHPSPQIAVIWPFHLGLSYPRPAQHALHFLCRGRSQVRSTCLFSLGGGNDSCSSADGGSIASAGPIWLCAFCLNKDMQWRWGEFAEMPWQQFIHCKEPLVLLNPLLNAIHCWDHRSFWLDHQSWLQGVITA